MIDDALVLGVKHAALNFNVGRLLLSVEKTNSVPFISGTRTFYFDRTYLESLDQRIKPLSDSGALVSLILLNYAGSDPALNPILLHPGYDVACPNRLSAFNTVTAEGATCFEAAMALIAQYFSAGNPGHGRVVNYIVGNEVNSHWYWCNMGKVSMETFADDYLRTMRLCHAAVRRHSRTARVYLSLEHHWNMRYATGDTRQTFAGRPFIDYFARRAKEGGDFDWHVAFHPYPENLFEPRTWNDKSATRSEDTPRITFKNIEMLPRYLRRTELLYQGERRRVILSEQGFHSPAPQEGQLWQAAAYCYAYRKVAELDGIDAFILHRHVDHQGEGGLNLGLWERKPGTISEPGQKKRLYEIFRAADTPAWEEAFRFALPIIGITNWSQLSSY